MPLNKRNSIISKKWWQSQTKKIARLRHVDFFSTAGNTERDCS